MGLSTFCHANSYPDISGGMPAKKPARWAIMNGEFAGNGDQANKSRR
jgi:hypothetical protein